MRIAHVHADLPPDTHGGVAWQVHRLASAQVVRGRDATVISFSRRPPGAPYPVATLPPPGRAFPRGLARLFGAGVAFARADYRGYDLVHFHGDSHLARPGVPTVRTFYGSALAEMRHATSWRFRLSQAVVYPMELVAMARADHAVGISDATRWALPCVRTIVPCGVDARVFAPGGERSGVPSILFVGTLSGRKRGSLLVRAFTEVVRSRIPDASLSIVGPEPASGPGIAWLGRVAEDELVRAYRRAWVFCLPSSYEGFGVPYLEALGCGTPVVATPNAGAREVLEGGRLGVLADPARLGEALVSLLTDAPRRAELARAGRAKAEELDWERIVARYDALYRELVGGGRS